MNDAEKIDMIYKLIGELNQNNDDLSSYLFLGGNIPESKIFFRMTGNPEVLSMAFGSYMEKNKEFNSIMLSMFGSYLSLRPEDKFKFMSIFEVASSTISQN
jgi:hypothetical protein